LGDKYTSVGYRWRENVYCLVLGIMRDYHSGAIDRYRLRYLVALNKASGWMPDMEAELIVDRRLEKMELAPKAPPSRRRRAAAIALAR
jgi:hypothetical protein